MLRVVDSITDSAELLSGLEMGLIGQADRHPPLLGLTISFKKAKVLPKNSQF
jgi:hypothetical protein